MYKLSSVWKTIVPWTAERAVSYTHLDVYKRQEGKHIQNGLNSENIHASWSVRLNRI